MDRSLKNPLLLVLVSALLTLPCTGRATKILHRNIKQIVDASKRAFVGSCASVSEGVLEFDNGGKLYYTEYTFDVSESLKGGTGQSITFRQLGRATPVRLDETHASLQRIPGMPYFRPNQEYLLFLIGDSRLGLTSPVGLFQGAFAIESDEYGNKLATNGFLNRGLFNDLSERQLEGLGLSQSDRRLCAQKKGPFQLGDFTSFVRKLVQDGR